MTVMLQCRDLTVRFALPRGQQITAVDQISFTVQQGEAFGIIGESGSGKSSLGRALVCLTKPSAGQVLHQGENPNALNAAALRRHRARYQIIFQDPNAALDPRQTILRSVREPLDIQRIGTVRDRDAAALAMLERVALGHAMAQRYPHELSGGQKQRACIARALVLNPLVLVCDEMVAALDVSIQAEILNLFAALQRDFNLTTILITHNLAVVAHAADRIGVMYFGKLVELAPAETLMETPLHPYTAALLSAEPNPVPGTRRARTILSGEIPSARTPPTGCRFHTRCPHAQQQCRTDPPAWRELRPGHHVACHFAAAA
jgi:oligopeptide/dipeptide ABC transporter ATP-binding protein